VARSAQRRDVLFDHDGGVDDLLSLMMLLAMPHINLIGVVVTPADCFLRPAVSASLKILRFFERFDIELSEGSLHGVNPFPRAWRRHAYAIDALPILNELPHPDSDRHTATGDTEAVEPIGADANDTPFPGAPSPYSQQNVFNDLRLRLFDRLAEDLGPALDTLPVDEVRQAVNSSFDRLVSQENIVLSRAEQQRLLEAIWAEFAGRLERRMPRSVAEPGHEFLARKLREASNPVTVLITGPVSNLAVALKAEPDLVSRIETVVWMGGALNVSGNVRDYEHDGSAEWNAYWDPPAVHSLWHSSVPITLFSLDVTDKVPVTMDFLHRLARQRRYPLSDLAGQCWALTVGTIPSYAYVYHMWDTLTTGYLGVPDLITTRQVCCEVVPNGPSAGRTVEVTDGGRLIQAADDVDVNAFLNYVLELFRR
jgi:inosine-uridine nucleoside N-ribohydrolase